ncbi:alpha-amylase family glycosyl hydrolase [Thermohalobacter berrensis]|uniref:alpha-amylase n=1 Tax=Thermohalobacter berrensis TaxID=99594 RepID=A0A419T0W6_9FIRM|nr:alpha-amylase family glycosyl hydrolase [Thermohalobacter berrensis]RKD31220.1 hypothetical protein BET03_03575 [Thermohalobacter berrensis]
MFKKFISFVIIFSLILSIGCSNINEPEPISQNQESNEETILKVKNDGGDFSHKDLIYFIMTDRFYDGDKSNNNFKDVNKKDPKAFHGGDLKGIIKKLDYIKSLGATAIWITPVYKNQSYGYHGYWITDFNKLDPHLGTLEDLKKLVDQAHKRNIKVMLDYVVNHTGYKSPWLKDEKHKDWFHPKKDIHDWNDQTELENGWIYGLPDLDQSNPKVRNFLINNALWFIKETDIDGMRLDNVKHVPKDFWNEFAYRIKKEYPDFYLLGEVWSENPRYLELYHKLGIDGLTNYSLFKGIRETFTWYGKTSALINAIKRERFFSYPSINGVFLDNHYNKRFITAVGKHGDKYLKQALTFVMTYPAIPVIYYGTEIAMAGGDDPDNRRDMEWYRVDSSKMLKFYKKLVNLRQNNNALKEGKFRLLDYDEDFISYIRQKGKDSVIVVMNIRDKEKQVSINIPNDSKNYKDILSNKVLKVNDKRLKINLKPLDLLILVDN